MKKTALSTTSIVSSNWLNVVGPKCTAWPPTGGRALLENHLVYTLYLEIVIFYSMHRYYENKQFQICSLVSTEKSMFI